MNLPKRWHAFGVSALASALLMHCGCHTHGSLRRETAAVTITLTDIYYNQVLDNIARFMHNPASMPSFAIVNAGTVNVSDTWGGTISPNWCTRPL